MQRTRGWHWCPFCPSSFPYPTTSEPLRDPFPLGDAEIRVPGPNGLTYAAPNLILHYVVIHAYLPPAGFVEGLRTLAHHQSGGQVQDEKAAGEHRS